MYTKTLDYIENCQPDYYSKYLKLIYPRASSNLCVGDSAGTYTYTDIITKINLVKPVLQSIVKIPQTPVLILCDKSVELIVLMMSMWQSRLISICVSTSSTNLDHLQNLITTNGISHIIYSEAYIDIIDQLTNIQKINIKLLFSTRVLSDTIQYMPLPSDYMYWICTSGTTGTPKLIKITSQMFSLFLDAMDDMLEQLGISGIQLKCLSLCNMSFDPVYIEIFYIIYRQSFVYVASSSLLFESLNDKSCGTTVSKGLGTIQSILDQYSINFLVTMPHSANILADMNLCGMDLIIFGGGQLTKHVADLLVTKSKNFVQMYGLTESTVVASWKKMCIDTNPANIGKPLKHYNISLDSNSQIMIDSICCTMYPSSLATGDYAFVELTDYIYTGRSLIKRFGIRIDPTHLNHVISLVVSTNYYVHTDNQLLVVFIESIADNELKTTLNNELTRHIGSHAVPDNIYCVDSLKYTSNGKVDVASMIPNTSDVKFNTLLLQDIQSRIASVLGQIINKNVYELFDDWRAQGYDINYEAIKFITLSEYGIDSIGLLQLFSKMQSVFSPQLITYSEYIQCKSMYDLECAVYSNTKTKRVQDNTDNKIIPFVASVLNLPEHMIGVHTTLQDMGVSSLNFLEIKSMVYAKHGWYMKPSDLYCTCTELNDKIIVNSKCAIPNFEYVDKKSDTIMIFTYPISGSSMVHYELAMFFSYDLLFTNFSPDLLSINSLEELARYHIDTIIKTIGRKRVIFVGWSFGGILAVTMSNILCVDYDIVVSALVILDSYPMDKELAVVDYNNNWCGFIEKFVSTFPQLNIPIVNQTIRHCMNLVYLDDQCFTYKKYKCNSSMLYIQCTTNSSQSWIDLFNTNIDIRKISIEHHQFQTQTCLPFLVYHIKNFLKFVNVPYNQTAQLVNPSNTMYIFDLDGVLNLDPTGVNVEKITQPNHRGIELYKSVTHKIVSSAHPNFDKETGTLYKLLHLEIIDEIDTDRIQYMEDPINHNKVAMYNNIISVGNLSTGTLNKRKIYALNYCNIDDFIENIVIVDDRLDILKYNYQISGYLGTKYKLYFYHFI